MLTALLLLSCPLPQDPAPEVPLELPAPLDGSRSQLDEVDRLADQVRDGFRKVDTGLREARDRVGSESADAAGFTEGLGQSAIDADQLLADMEELLAAIPDVKGEGKSGGKKKPPGEPEEARNLDASDEKRDRPDSLKESEQGQGAPPNSYLRLLFDQDAGAWGMLPPRLQEALQNAVMEDLPLRYRRWLDDFHRR